MTYTQRVEHAIESLNELLDHVDQEELRLVLFDFFGGEGAISNEGAISLDQIYVGELHNPAIVLSYEEGRIVSIAPGPAFRSSNIEEFKRLVAAELLRSEQRVGRAVFAASVPVSGHWSFRPIMQIRPAPSHAPRMDPLYPFIIEFKYEGSTNGRVDQLRRNRRLQELGLLFALLVEPRSWPIARVAGGYRIRGIRHTGTRFSTLRGEPIPEEDSQAFYSRIGHKIGASLTVPRHLRSSLDCFSRAAANVKHAFLRSAYWLRFANGGAGGSQSAAYVALIISIESLMPASERFHITRRFVEFLERFAPPADGGPDPSRRALYEMRSDLAHGRALLRPDLDGWTWATVDPEGMQQHSLFQGASHLARIAAVNWLHDTGGQS